MAIKMRPRLILGSVMEFEFYRKRFARSRWDKIIRLTERAQLMGIRCHDIVVLPSGHHHSNIELMQLIKYIASQKIKEITIINGADILSGSSYEKSTKDALDVK